jgi:hypothetical protein
MSYVNPFQNVPSASKLHRVLECPGSHQAEFAAPQVEEDTTEANIGNEVHAILAGELTEDNASVEAVQTAEMCERQVLSLITEWGHDDNNKLSEKRYGLTRLGGVVEVTESTKADVIFTGQFDRLYISGTHGLLIDFKSLRGDHATAIENPQLMSLAVLVAKKHKLTDVRVALVQPMKGKPTTADFNANGLKLAESWLFAALDAEMEAGPDDRRAGKWCKYCKARFSCPTFRDVNINALDVVQPETLPADAATRNKTVFARMAEMTPQQLIHIEKNVVGLMGAFIAAHKAVFKQRVEAGEIPGYTTREKKGKRSIIDVTKVFAACEAHGVTAEQFTALCSIGLGDVKQLLKDATHLKGKALDNLHDAVLTGAVEVGKSSVELVPAGQLE